MAHETPHTTAPNPYQPMHAEHLQTQDSLHYKRMVEIAEDLRNNNPNAVQDRVLTDQASYVALADVCAEASRNPAMNPVDSPYSVRDISARILDAPMEVVDYTKNSGTEQLFDYDTYLEQRWLPAGDKRRVATESYNRAPELPRQIDELFDDIRFETQFLADNPRFAEFKQLHEELQQSISSSPDPALRAEEVAREAERNPAFRDKLRKYSEGANSYDQAIARINRCINNLATAIDNNRDYAILARKKFESILGTEASALAKIEAARAEAEKADNTYTEAADKRSMHGFEMRANTAATHNAQRKADRLAEAYTQAEEQLEAAKQSKADNETIKRLKARVDDLYSQSTTARTELETLETSGKGIAYNVRAASYARGQSKAAADKANGAILTEKIKHRVVNTFNTAMLSAIEQGSLKLDYNFTRADREAHARSKAQLQSMVRSAIRHQTANNTTEQEHDLFVVQAQILARKADLEKQLRDADPKKHDPRAPELRMWRNEITDLEGVLAYHKADLRLQRAETKRSPHNPDFSGRSELLRLADGGILIEDGSDTVLYPDGSRAYLKPDGTLTKRRFAGRPYTPPRPEQRPQPKQPDPKTTRRLGSVVFGRFGRKS